MSRVSHQRGGTRNLSILLGSNSAKQSFQHIPQEKRHLSQIAGPRVKLVVLVEYDDSSAPNGRQPQPP